MNAITAGVARGRFGPARIYGKKAFSLVEMVIAISIIGILTIFTLMYYMGTIEDTKVAKTKIMLEQIKDACRRFYAENGFYPTEIRHLYPKYLTRIPMTPWNTPFQINFGEVTEVVCTIPLEVNYKRRMALTIDTIGFAPDNFFDITGQPRAAFSFGKMAVSAASTGETQVFNIDFQIQFKSFVTAATLEHGCDFRFQVTGAEIESAASLQSVPIEISGLGGAEKSGFEYSSKKETDTIKVKIINCKRTSGFIFQLYRPLDADIPMYYGPRMVMLTGQNSTPPITLTRSMGESTKRQ